MWTYQGARILAYSALGAVFGGIGAALDLSFGVTVSKLMPYLLVTTFVLSALDLQWRPRWKIPLPSLPRQGLPFAIGAISALIPCGFLYSTAPLAIATGSTASGALFLAFFALGTAPALLLSGVFSSRVVAHRWRRPLLLLAALLVSLRAFALQPEPTPAPAPLCNWHNP